MSVEIPKVEMTTEEKLKGVRGAWPLWVGVMAKAVVDKYGDEGSKVLRDALRNQGRIHGQKVLKERMHVGPTLRDFVEGYMLKVAFAPLGYEFEIAELTESRAVIHAIRCPLWERWKPLGVPDEMCDIWDSYQRGIREALNPANTIIHRHGKRMIKGDPYCELIWEIPELGGKDTSIEE